MSTRKQLDELRQTALANPTEENYRRLLNARAEYLRMEEERRAAFERREAAAKARLAASQREEGFASSSSANPTNESTTTPRQSGGTGTVDGRALEHLLLWTKVQKACFTRTLQLKHYLANPYDCQECYLELVSSWLDGWGTFFDDIQRDLKKLKIFNKEHPCVLPSLEELYNAVDTMCRQQLSARSFIGHERRRLARRGEASVEAFVDHAESLEQWLQNAAQREQTLVTLRDYENFHSYLVRNQAKVDDGLLALSSEAEGLIPAKDQRVSQGLKNCFRMWVHLTLQTFEKIHDETVACHEDEMPERCKKFLEVEAPVIGRYLSHSAPHVLRTQELGLKRVEAEQLLDAHHVMELLANHLMSYKARDRAVHRAFQCLANAVRCPVTTFMLHLPTYEDYEGRKEHHQRLQELQEWVEVHCQKKTFMQLLERTKLMTKMLEDYEKTLTLKNNS